MVKTRMMVCAAVAFAVLLALGSVQCAAEQAEAPAAATRAEVNGVGFQPALEELYVVVMINIHKVGENSWAITEVSPKGPDICRDLRDPNQPMCNGTQFLWVVIGPPMQSDEQVIIRAADGYDDCFHPGEWVIQGPNFATRSGAVTCDVAQDQNKHGILWPYDVEFWKNGDKKTWTDPRGIVH